MTSHSVTDDFDPKHVILGPNDGEPRIIHTMVRVKNIDRSLGFYVDGLGMTVLERLDIEAEEATAVFVGYGGGDAGAPLGLVCYRDGEGSYTHGSGYGHVAVGVADLPTTFARLEAAGAEIVMRPGVLVPGGASCAFVKDPDGYSVELLET